MKLVLSFACLVLITLSYALQPAPLQDETAARLLTEAAMEKVVAGEYEAAFETLKPYWLLPVSELNGLAATTVTQRASVEARFGESLGYELISQETVGDSFLRLPIWKKLKCMGCGGSFGFISPGIAGPSTVSTGMTASSCSSRSNDYW